MVLPRSTSWLCSFLCCIHPRSSAWLALRAKVLWLQESVWLCCLSTSDWASSCGVRCMEQECYHWERNNCLFLPRCCCQDVQFCDAAHHLMWEPTMSATAGHAPTVGGKIMGSDMSPIPDPSPCSEHTDNGSSMVDLHPALSECTNSGNLDHTPGPLGCHCEARLSSLPGLLCPSFSA